MNEVVEKLPKSVWLTTMPQLISRLLHPSKQVVEVLMDLLAALVAAYPDQALWYVVPVTRSADSERAARARSIVKSAVSLAKSKRVAEVLGAGGTLVKELIRVCIQGVPQRVGSAALLHNRERERPKTENLFGIRILTYS